LQTTKPLRCGNLLIELLGLGQRRYIQFDSESLDTELILPNCQVALTLTLIAAHEPAMRLFMAVILSQHLLAESDCFRIFTLL
jgi:hypothetical protein